MQRKPRRMNPRPGYHRGQRLRAADIRRTRQQRLGPRPARPAPPQAGPGGRATGGGQPPRRRWSPLRLVALGFPIFALAVAAVFLLPLLIQAHGTMTDVFQTPAARLKVTENPEGTAVIVPDATEPASLPDWEKKERVNILLLGVDRREGTDEPPRSDTMIIVTINPATHKVGMLSIPRDLLVTIPSYGDDKINAAYSAGEQMGIEGGGPALVRATIEYNFDIPIHYYAEVDFHGFTKIVDTLGGVTIDVPAPIKDDQYPGPAHSYTRIYFHTGLQHMDGETALRYARTRHDDNDFARGMRQQQVLMALREQGVQLGLITKAHQLLSDLGDTVRTDLSPTQVLALGKLATEIKQGDIQTYNLLGGVEEHWDERGYYQIPNWDAIHATLNEMMPPTPTPTVPPSTQEPDLQATILVQNATYVNQLAGNAVARLAEAGFTAARAEQSPETGNVPASRVINYSDNPATAERIAEILGLPKSAVQPGDPAQANGDDIVVVLGDDAPVAASGG